MENDRAQSWKLAHLRVAAGILPAVAGGIPAAWLWLGVRHLVSGVRLEAGPHGRLEARRYVGNVVIHCDTGETAATEYRWGSM